MFVGNWKTYKTTMTEVQEFFRDLPVYSSRFKPEYEVALAPATIHLASAGGLMPSNIALCAQDCSPFPPGAHSGHTTAEQLKANHVKYCILGHFERRADGETDEQINGKIKRCLENGISPIVCFGETLVDYDNDMTRVVVERQMRDCLRGVTQMENVVLCYTPLWSIGTGFYTTGDYSNIIADFMRKTAVKLTGNPMAANCTILFGGQITSTNVREYLEAPEVDGVMFAIAALKPADFAEIVGTPFNINKMLRVDPSVHNPNDPKKVATAVAAEAEKTGAAAPAPQQGAPAAPAQH